MGGLYVDDSDREGQSGDDRRHADRSTVHEQPSIERHRVPGAVPVGEYHQYFHGDRWNGTDPHFADGEVDWLATDEWFAYDLDVVQPARELCLQVASAEGFGGGEVGIVFDDEPVSRIQFDATGGWYDWIDLTVELPVDPGGHTLRLVVYDGGWKLREFTLR